MDKETLRKQWLEEERKGFSGWDFSYLDGRWEMEPLPWDYQTIVDRYRKNTDLLLDMGTGAGEVLLGFNHPYPNTYVTEGYRPNYELCVQKLAPLGIHVAYIDETGTIPYADNSFDIVINRHESYDPQEVYRVLKPGGIFITQQVGGRNSYRLAHELLGDAVIIRRNQFLDQAVLDLEHAGFMILASDEYEAELKFDDVGALVYYAKIIEWEFPGFDVETLLIKLYALQERIEEHGSISNNEHRYYCIARK